MNGSDEINRRRKEEVRDGPPRWVVVGGYDGARHALFVKQDGPWLDPAGAEVEVMPVEEHDAEIAAITGAITLFGDSTLHDALDAAGLLMDGREDPTATP